MSSADDWKIDVTPEEKVPIPSFIRLFVFNRILYPYITDKTTTETTSDDVIRSMLVTVLNSKEEKQAAFAILSQLFKNGLKKYMNEDFDIRVHPILIEKIHNQLILTTFSEEYSFVTKYTTSNNSNDNINNNNNNNDTSCQSLVFNTNDLMCCIFQFLSYRVKLKDKNNDLLRCSLVNSHWLYYVFNPNSCSEINFAMLWNISGEDNNEDEENEDKDAGVAVIDKIQARLWQRIIKVKSVNYHTPRRSQLSKNNAHDELLGKISMLNNVEKIACRTTPSNIIVLKALLQQCRKNIKHFDVAIGNRRTRASENLLSPLTLPNAEDISISDKYFNIIWSNKCKVLRMFMLAYISKDWCNFVINNCDCGGIKHLVIDDISFDNSVNLRSNSNININRGKNENNYKISILSLLAKQFRNIEKLDIILELRDFTAELGLLWQEFGPIIQKNNTYVTFTIRKSISPVQEELLTFIDKNNIKINQIISRLYTDEMDESLCIIIEKCQDLESINIKNRRKTKNGIALSKFIEKLEKISLGSGINDINSNKNINLNENYDDEDENEDDQTVVDVVDKTIQSSNYGHGLTELKRIELIESLEPASIDFLTDLLSLKFIVERKIFPIVVIGIEITNVYVFDESAFLLKFKHFCQKIYVLLFEDQLPMNIKIKFGTLDTFGDKCIAKMQQVFKSVFDENMVLSQFKLSKQECNKYCTNMEIPVISLTQSDADNVQLEFCAANAHAIKE